MSTQLTFVRKCSFSVTHMGLHQTFYRKCSFFVTHAPKQVILMHQGAHFFVTYHYIIVVILIIVITNKRTIGKLSGQRQKVLVISSQLMRSLFTDGEGRIVNTKHCGKDLHHHRVQYFSVFVFVFSILQHFLSIFQYFSVFFSVFQCFSIFFIFPKYYQNCVTQLMLYTGDKLSSSIFCL